MRNIILTIITTAFFVLSSNSQTINWLSNSDFEKIVADKSSKTFILIIDSSLDNKGEREGQPKKRKNMFGFLEDTEIVKFLNENFSCYKFDIAKSSSLVFNDTEYKIIKEGSRTKHEFVKFLSGAERVRIPSIILRDKEFKLYNYDRKEIITEEIEILLEAEKNKLDFLSKKLGDKNKHVKRSSEIINKLNKDLSSASIGKQSQSVLPLRGKADFIKTLQYFINDYYKTIDYQNYLIKKQ